MSLTCLPRCVSQCLRVLRPCFHHRHHLVFSWPLVLHLVYGDRANLKELSRHGPGPLAYQHYRRLLCAAYWCTKALLSWFADQALQALPPPEDGLLSLVADSTLKGKRGSKHPVAQKTRLSQYHPYGFGFRIVILIPSAPPPRSNPLAPLHRPFRGKRMGCYEFAIRVNVGTGLCKRERKRGILLYT